MSEPGKSNGHPQGEPVLPAPPASIGTPLDPKLLEEAVPPPPRPIPWRAVALVALPAAALAGGRGVQWLLEGPTPSGDALLRWMLFSCGTGLLLGALAGRLLTRTGGGRLVWALWGALAPFVLAGAVSLGVAAARPLRAWAAEKGYEKCRQTRTVCSVTEFREACSLAARPVPGAKARVAGTLGPPAFDRCDETSCTLRWTYEGPWTPDNWVAPGALLCSVVTDPQGTGLRWSVAPGFEPRAP